MQLRIPARLRRQLLSVLTLMVATGAMHAQWLRHGSDAAVLKKYAKWGIGISLNGYFFFPESRTAGAELIPRRHTAWGGKAGFYVKPEIFPRWTLKTGIEGGRQLLYVYTVHLSREITGDKEAYFYVHSYAPWSLHIPLSLEYRFLRFSGYIPFLRAGMEAAYTPSLVTENLYHDRLVLRTQVSGGWKAVPFGGVGWYYAFPGLLWETAIVYRGGASDLWQAVWRVFPAEGDVKGGKAGGNGSYVALSFTWYLKKPSAGDDAECPGQVHGKKVLRRKKIEEKARRRAEKVLEKARKKEQRRHKKRKKRLRCRKCR